MCLPQQYTNGREIVRDRYLTQSVWSITTRKGGRPRGTVEGKIIAFVVVVSHEEPPRTHHPAQARNKRSPPHSEFKTKGKAAPIGEGATLVYSKTSHHYAAETVVSTIIPTI